METDTTASTTVMYTYQPQPQVLPVQTQVISVRQSAYNTEKSVGLGVAEIILRIICLIVCLAMLVAAALAVTTINDIDDIESQYIFTFRDAEKYREAAIWLLFVGIAAVFYHGTVIFIRGLYFNPNIRNYFAGFSFTNAVLCLLFGIALLAGAIVNSMYGSDNLNRYNNSDCISDPDVYYDSTDVEKLCDNLETLYQSESVAAGAAFFSLILIIPLLILAIMNGVRKMREAPYHRSSELSAPPPPPYANLQNSDF